MRAPKTLLLLLLLKPTLAQEADVCAPTFRGCSICGTAKTKRQQQQALLKNRTEPPTRAPRLSLSRMLSAQSPADLDQSAGATATGYVASVSRGPREAVNCGRSDLRDLRIALVPRARQRLDKRKWVIAEITPRGQEKLNVGLSDAKKLVGKKVRIRGWLFFDAAHARDRRSRGTAWEIHPVTEIEVTMPPETSPQRDRDKEVRQHEKKAGKPQQLARPDPSPRLPGLRRPGDRLRGTLPLRTRSHTNPLTSPCRARCQASAWLSIAARLPPKPRGTPISYQFSCSIRARHQSPARPVSR